MVTIVDCVKRTSHEGNDFIALIVQDELQIVTSNSGNVYVAARKASIPSTLEFDEAKMMIGKELPGCIQKVEVPPFEHVNSDGEIVHLNHRWQYVPESHLTEQQAREVEELEELEVETV
ncbi:hypothetical protein D1614_22830 [Maribellus luteus]|uniref:Uncharacterized protein n=1 Tax=Maribellus luteus TaxID=2305463 RepID=A0A399SND4_9BACT|nr:hypothetical protein [Maribellus luteus]RIJ45506.1 hypothetical protein D1614_22830 [Maribellus luteus]